MLSGFMRLEFHGIRVAEMLLLCGASSVGFRGLGFGHSSFGFRAS